MLGSLASFFMDDDRPQPPSITPPTPVNFEQSLAEAMAASNNINPQLLINYLRDAPQFAQAQTNILGQQAPQMANIYAQNYANLLPRLTGTNIEAMELANPGARALQADVIRKAQEGLNLGGRLSDTERFDTQQELRSAQSKLAPGGQGIAELFDESRFLRGTEFNRGQARLGNAMGALGLGPNPGMASSVNVPGPQAASTGHLLQQLNPGSLFAANMANKQGNQGLFANYNNQVMGRFVNDPNTYALTTLDKLLGMEAQLAGVFSGAAGSMLGGGGGGGGGGTGSSALMSLMGGGTAGAGSALAAFCWVASEIYGGWTEPRTEEFREIVRTKAPKWLRNLYIKHGEKVAAWLKKNSWAKAPVKAAFDLIRRLCKNP